jgi:3-oxoacyl-[acyl-carrier protein] reductase
MDRGRLQDRVAIVTGGAGGIGKATAYKMIHEGASVIIVDILPAETKQVANELNALGGKARGIIADITRNDEVDQVIEHATKEFGKVDILVNNAGIVLPALLEDVKEEDWDRVVSVNLKGTCFCTQAMLLIMRKNRYGKIIHIGSRASLGKTDRTVYAATKGGLIGVTRTWALELAPFNNQCQLCGAGAHRHRAVQVGQPCREREDQGHYQGHPFGKDGPTRGCGQPHRLLGI